jgi:hypothetical protein
VAKAIPPITGNQLITERIQLISVIWEPNHHRAKQAKAIINKPCLFSHFQWEDLKAEELVWLIILS